MSSLAEPVVSLPWQYLTVPFGGLSIDAGSMTLAPLTSVPPLVLAPPPPVSLPPLLPHAASATQPATKRAANANCTLIRFLPDIWTLPPPPATPFPGLSAYPRFPLRGRVLTGTPL